MIAISLDDLSTYARCPLAWWWEKRAGAEKPVTPEQLAPAAVRQALAYYYAGHAESVGAGIGLVWRDWCEAWGDTGIADDLMRYQGGRARILAEFENGRVTRPDGSRYDAPQMTTAYRSMMHKAGLLKIARRLDAFAAGRGLLVSTDPRVETSAFGDAYADGVLIADRLRRPPGGEAGALPAREIVLGARVPYLTTVGEFQVAGQADLVMEAGPTESDGGANEFVDTVAVEVHDYGALRLTLSAAARSLRVIAAWLARPVGEVTWRAVDRVIYRHMRSGETWIVRHASPARLLTVIAAVTRGMQYQIVIPRALTGLNDCRDCAHRARCFGEGGWDALDFVDPTTTALAVFDEFSNLADSLSSREREELWRGARMIAAGGARQAFTWHSPYKTTHKNLDLRIRRNCTPLSFRVKDGQASHLILGAGGAEVLPPRHFLAMLGDLVQGVAFAPDDGEITEFLGSRPAPAIPAPTWLTNHAPSPQPFPDPSRDLAEQIRPAWEQGASKRAMARSVGKEYAGHSRRNWMRR